MPTPVVHQVRRYRSRPNQARTIGTAHCFIFIETQSRPPTTSSTTRPDALSPTDPQVLSGTANGPVTQRCRDRHYSETSLVARLVVQSRRIALSSSLRMKVFAKQLQSRRFAGCAVAAHRPGNHPLSHCKRRKRSFVSGRYAIGFPLFDCRRRSIMLTLAANGVTPGVNPTALDFLRDITQRYPGKRHHRRRRHQHRWFSFQRTDADHARHLCSQV